MMLGKLFVCVLLTWYAGQAIGFECSMSAFENELYTKLNQLELAFSRLDSYVDHMQNTQRQYQSARGSSYIRWGRTECSGNGTSLVYKGYSGGSHYDKTGGAANYICLHEDPDWAVHDYEESKEGATVYGTEYQFEFSPDRLFAGTRVQGSNAMNVPCAVCQAPRSDVLMIPGKLSCPIGWNVEYSGYLAAGLTDFPAPSEYVCLDGRPEPVPGKVINNNENVIYVVESRCGTLPCSVYPSGRELTCVVCSK